MTEKKRANNASKGDLVLHQTEDGRTRIECRFEGETVWLTQALMAELFDIGVGTVNHHLKEIYAEGELSPEATIRRHRIVRTEGQRTVAREIEHYDLDARRPRSSSRSLPAVARREGAGSHEPLSALLRGRRARARLVRELLLRHGAALRARHGRTWTPWWRPSAGSPSRARALGGVSWDLAEGAAARSRPVHRPATPPDARSPRAARLGALREPPFPPREDSGALSAGEADRFGGADAMRS